MIEVIVHYYNRAVKCKNKNDYIVYPYFMVKGHANNGASSQDCQRVCAGVSACVIGITRLIDTSQYSVTLKSGFFEIRTLKTIDKDVYIDQDTNYALNTLLCQLYDIKQMYPTQFSSFEMIEVKEKNKKVYERKSKPKPFRELKKARLGSSSN